MWGFKTVRPHYHKRKPRSFLWCPQCDALVEMKRKEHDRCYLICEHVRPVDLPSGNGPILTPAYCEDIEQELQKEPLTEQEVIALLQAQEDDKQTNIDKDGTDVRS